MREWQRDSHQQWTAPSGDGEQHADNWADELPFFFARVVVPAHRELRREFESLDRRLELFKSDSLHRMVVRLNGRDEFDYTVKVRIYSGHASPYAAVKSIDPVDGHVFHEESCIKRGWDDSIYNVTRDDLIEHFVATYARHVRPVQGV